MQKISNNFFSRDFFDFLRSLVSSSGDLVDFLEVCSTGVLEGILELKINGIFEIKKASGEIQALDL